MIYLIMEWFTVVAHFCLTITFQCDSASSVNGNSIVTDLRQQFVYTIFQKIRCSLSYLTINYSQIIGWIYIWLLFKFKKIFTRSITIKNLENAKFVKKTQTKTYIYLIKNHSIFSECHTIFWMNTIEFQIEGTIEYHLPIPLVEQILEIFNFEITWQIVKKQFSFKKYTSQLYILR